MTKVCCAFVWSKCGEQVADPLPGCFDGSFFGLAQQGLELGEDHLDWIEIWAVGWQEEQLGTDAADCVAHRFAFVATEVVDNDDVASVERWYEELPDPSGEGDPVDRPVDDARCDDAVVSQPGEEGRRLPVPVRNLGQKWLASRAPAARAGHVGLDPGLVDENQPGWIKAVLIVAPSCPQPRQARPFRLAWQQSFF